MKSSASMPLRLGHGGKNNVIPPFIPMLVAVGTVSLIYKIKQNKRKPAKTTQPLEEEEFRKALRH